MDLRLLSLALVGCIPPFDVPELHVPTITADVQVRPADSSELYLVHVLTVSTDEPTQLTVELSGADTVRSIAFPTFSTSHEVPLLGLVEASDYTATAFLTDAAGFEIAGGPVTFNAGEAAAPSPVRTVHVNDLTRREPGYTLYPAKVAGEDAAVSIALAEAVDEQGRLVWQFSPPRPPRPSQLWSITSLQVHPADGTLSGIVNNRAIRRFDFAEMGVQQTWSAEFEARDGEIPIALSQRFHAEAAFVDDGSFWTLTHQERAVDGFPVDSSDLTVREEAKIRTDVVVHVLASGQILETWDLWTDLDQDRIGFEIEDSDTEKYDWSAGNAIVPLGEDEFLVSLASQNAVVKYDGHEIVWILGNHAGWDDECCIDLLLDPVEDETTWFSQQHAPAFDESGRLWLFDNGSYDRGTPYGPAEDPEGTPDYSRVVAYDIDEACGTFAEVFDFGKENAPVLFSNSRGNADPLPVTGNVLATYGAIHDVAAGDSMRILEIDPTDGTVVFDLELTGDPVDAPGGWQGDRAIHVSSFYPPDVIVTVLE